MIHHMIAALLSLTTLPEYNGVHPHGYWYGEEPLADHKTDFPLASALVQFFQAEKAHSIVDFGCGMGDYVKILAEIGFDCEGYDGHPDTFVLSEGYAQVADLSQPLDLQRKFDWVLSLEVAEHLPKEYEKTFIDNLHRHNTKGLVLSWAVKGQGGHGHFNEQNNDYVKDLMAQYGYINDIEAEIALRNQSTYGWFRNTLMVFRKIPFSF